VAYGSHYDIAHSLFSSIAARGSGARQMGLEKKRYRRVGGDCRHDEEAPSKHLNEYEYLGSGNDVRGTTQDVLHSRAVR